MNTIIDHKTITTLGELKAAKWQSLSVKDELRKNLIAAILSNKPVFEGIYGYEDTVIPDLERAILARHNILLLGLRGQAKTRLARLMTNLLDEYMPIIADSEINDNPYHPLSAFGKEMVAKFGDKTLISWVHRSDRYTEKLATPDVTIADLIGDSDPIKAANLKLNYADERVIHFGLLARANRGIFVINELPDLQARIQVALFNILQEGDIQIRGFKVRLPLDLQMIFTANPEDYTNRGSIVTPLKDRIESQILTHYPKRIDFGMAITSQESAILQEQRDAIHMPEVGKMLIEQLAITARHSELVDQKSGVSARLTIAAYEQAFASAERRRLKNAEPKTTIRMSDLMLTLPAITGKVELVYEGEQEGAAMVAKSILKRAVKEVFLMVFPNPEKFRKKKIDSPYQKVLAWFENAQIIQLLNECNNGIYASELKAVEGLEELVYRYLQSCPENELLFMMELVLHGLSEHSLLGRKTIETETVFTDVVAGMFQFPTGEDLNS